MADQADSQQQRHEANLARLVALEIKMDALRAEVADVKTQYARADSELARAITDMSQKQVEAAEKQTKALEGFVPLSRYIQVERYVLGGLLALAALGWMFVLGRVPQ